MSDEGKALPMDKVLGLTLPSTEKDGAEKICHRDVREICTQPSGCSLLPSCSERLILLIVVLCKGPELEATSFLLLTEGPLCVSTRALLLISGHGGILHLHI